jgi:DNA polymerase III gamma/tau subunit
MINISSDNIDFLNDNLRKNILTSISSNSLNSFIIGGPKGLGKVNFVTSLSKYLLCELENNEKINIDDLKNSNYSFTNIKKNKSFHLFDNQSHPDFFYLKNDKENYGKIIPIENVRKLKKFFHKTYSVSKTKIAVIDKIEDLSLNSLNSLLKTIEELPEKSYIFIISDKPMNIIETIKSRCNLFYIKPLNKTNFINFIENNFNNISVEEKFFLKSICNGSPGLAEQIINNKIYNIYNDFLDSLINSHSFSSLTEKILKLFTYSTKNNDFLFSTFHLIINDIIKKSSFFLHNKKFLEHTLDKEKKIIEIISNNNNALKLLNLHSKFDKNMHSADLVNLNKSEILIDTVKDLFKK